MNWMDDAPSTKLRGLLLKFPICFLASIDRQVDGTQAPWFDPKQQARPGFHVFNKSFHAIPICGMSLTDILVRKRRRYWPDIETLGMHRHRVTINFRMAHNRSQGFDTQ